MTVVEGLLRFTLSALHASVWLRDAIYFSLLWFWTGLTSALKEKGSKLDCIQEDARELKKIPQHLTLIVHEERLSCTDLAKLVTWAFAAGIHKVSIYDSHGTIVDHTAELHKALVSKHQQMFSPPVPDVEVYTSEQMTALHSHDHCQPEINHGQTSSYSLLLLTPQDGQRNIVSVAQEMSRLVMQRKLKTSEIDTTMVNKRLSAMRGFPDPELALVFGGVHSTLGFPPWQMRLTEILFLGSHHKVAYQDFLTSLQRYSNCQQRLGK